MKRAQQLRTFSPATNLSKTWYSLSSCLDSSCRGEKKLVIILFACIQISGSRGDLERGLKQVTQVRLQQDQRVSKTLPGQRWPSRVQQVLSIQILFEEKGSILVVCPLDWQRPTVEMPKRHSHREIILCSGWAIFTERIPHLEQPLTDETSG